MITVACVRVGTKYGPEYVERLRNMVARHLPDDHRFICLTDQAETFYGVESVDVSGLGLPGWWSKMALFNPAARGEGRCLYFDLDTVIVGDLSPLAEWDGLFGICENFTRLAGHEAWPCGFGSCVMSFAEGWGAHVWDEFWRSRDRWMRECSKGDQQAIEALVPGAALLQGELPEGFFLNKRNLPDHRDKPPEGTSLVIFGGRQRPGNCEIEWVQEAWR